MVSELDGEKGVTLSSIYLTDSHLAICLSIYLSIIPIHIYPYVSPQVYECDPASGERVRRLTEPADLFAED